MQVEDENGKVHMARDLLPKRGFKPYDLDPKEGLALVNGDNFSCGLASLIAYDLTKLFLIYFLTSGITLQTLKGRQRYYHPLTHKVRPH